MNSKRTIACKIYDESVKRKLNSLVDHLSDTVSDKVMSIKVPRGVNECDMSYLTFCIAAIVKIPAVYTSDGTCISFVTVMTISHAVKPSDVKQTHSANIHNKFGNYEKYAHVVECSNEDLKVYEKIFKGVNKKTISEIKDSIEDARSIRDVVEMFPEYSNVLDEDGAEKERDFVKLQVLNGVLSEKY